MPAFTGVSSTSLISRDLSRQCLAPTKISGLKLVSFSTSGRTNLPLSFRRLQVSCAAKPETVEKVCDIVRKQLALKDESHVFKSFAILVPGGRKTDLPSCAVHMRGLTG
ncbi:hypothetical protein LXL04_034309 [Taraxacum kok-saghyz]